MQLHPTSRDRFEAAAVDSIHSVHLLAPLLHEALFTEASLLREFFSFTFFYFIFPLVSTLQSPPVPSLRIQAAVGLVIHEFLR